ncbi:MAG: glycosyl hydrolase family 18 protein [Candidatus Moranbacteria bacterium]|nr:glycosyl hydrolase family 18 protein [Candidatus Moranbacteria bacterium]
MSDLNRKKYSIAIALVCLIIVGEVVFVCFSGKEAPVDTFGSSSTPSSPVISDRNIPAEDANEKTVSKAPVSPAGPAAKIATDSRNTTEVMAWIYPGEPACKAPDEYANIGIVDVLKSEYFTVSDEGKLVFLTEKEAGCNGYSPENVAGMKKHSKGQYATVSSSYAKNMDVFLRKSLGGDDTIRTLVEFVVNNDMTGIELDFEDFGGWTGDIYPRYKEFVSALGDALHKKGKKLMIDGPAIANEEEAGWFSWRYEDMAVLPVDYAVIMLYDYQFDHGTGTPIAPIPWMKEVIARTKEKLPDIRKIVVGIPSYGYKGTIRKSQITILTYEQLRQEKGFETAVRDADSGEMTWRRGDVVYFYQDSESMRIKRKVIESLGITSVSVWHLGGNPWFQKE